MATYAIGDLQGCRVEFEALLDKIAIGADDELWLLGDLINRGADSLGTIRRVIALQQEMSVRIVLGNHDLHFLAILFGEHRPSAQDTFDEMLAAPDALAIAEWLCHQPLLYIDDRLQHAMVHAGVPHIWSLPQAQTLADEVSTVLRGKNPALSRETFFKHMYGNQPALWDDGLEGMARMRCVTNYLTRMRLVDEGGTLDFSHKGALDTAPDHWHPWFSLVQPDQFSHKLLFGHWAALDGETKRPDLLALDTGCVWGRDLTAICVETGVRTSVSAHAA